MRSLSAPSARVNPTRTNISNGTLSIQSNVCLRISHFPNAISSIQSSIWLVSISWISNFWTMMMANDGKRHENRMMCVVASYACPCMQRLLVQNDQKRRRRRKEFSSLVFRRPFQLRHFSIAFRYSHAHSLTRLVTITIFSVFSFTPFFVHMNCGNCCVSIVEHRFPYFPHFSWSISCACNWEKFRLIARHDTHSHTKRRHFQVPQ